MPIVEIPGQGQVEFPDTMSDDEIAKVITAERAKGLPPYGPGREALAGLTFGFSPKAEPIFRDMFSNVAGVFSGQPARQPAPDIAPMLAARDLYREQNPVESTVANIAGSLPTALIPGGVAAKTAAEAGMLGKTAATMAAGAVPGALYGAGEAPIGNEGSGAAQGGLLGLVAGPIGGVASRGMLGAGRMIGGVTNRLRGVPTIAPARKAESVVLGRLQAAGIDPASLSPQEGQYLAELSPTLEGAAGYAARNAPATAARVKVEIPNRQAQRQLSLADQIRRGISGRNVSMLEARDALDIQRQASEPYYRAAYQNAPPIVIPDTFVRRKAFQSAVDRANKTADAEGLPPIRLGGSSYLPGSQNQVSLEDANRIKQALDAVIYSGKKSQSENALDRTEIAALDSLRRDFVSAVDAQAPDSYKTARKIYAGPARAEEALDDGFREGPKMTGEELSRHLQGLSQSEQEAFRIGMSNALRQKILEKPSTANVAAGIQNRPAAMSQLGALADPQLLSDIQRAANAGRVDVGLLGGSQTAERVAADREIGGLLDDAVAQGVYQAATGNKSQLLMRAVDKTVGLARYGSQPAAEEIGNLLLTQDLARNRATIQRLTDLSQMLQSQAPLNTGSAVFGAGLLGGQVQ